MKRLYHEGRSQRAWDLAKLRGATARLEAFICRWLPRPCIEREDTFRDLYYLVKMARKRKP